MWTITPEPKPATIINGEPWWNWLYEYEFEGATYSFSVMARSQIEAHARMKKIALARYVGQADGNPVSLSRGGWLVPFVVWWRNWSR